MAAPYDRTGHVNRRDRAGFGGLDAQIFQDHTVLRCMSGGFGQHGGPIWRVNAQPADVNTGCLGDINYRAGRTGHALPAGAPATARQGDVVASGNHHIFDVIALMNANLATFGRQPVYRLLDRGDIAMADAPVADRHPATAPDIAQRAEAVAAIQG